MFKVTQSPAYWWPVKLRQTLPDKPGKFETVTFDVQFVRVDAPEQAAWLTEVRDRKLSDAEYVQPLVTGFRKVCDDDGSEIPWNVETFAQMLRQPGVASAIAEAYFDSHPQAGEKN